MNNGRICGTGAACEQYCPVMRIGRSCPNAQDIINEWLEAGINPFDQLIRLAPEPA